MFAEGRRSWQGQGISADGSLPCVTAEHRNISTAQAPWHLLSGVCLPSSTPWVAPGMSLTQPGNSPASSCLQLHRMGQDRISTSGSQTLKLVLHPRTFSRRQLWLGRKEVKDLGKGGVSNAEAKQCWGQGMTEIQGDPPRGCLLGAVPAEPGRPSISSCLGRCLVSLGFSKNIRALAGPGCSPRLTKHPGADRRSRGALGQHCSVSTWDVLPSPSPALSGLGTARVPRTAQGMHTRTSSWLCLAPQAFLQHK